MEWRLYNNIIIAFIKLCKKFATKNRRSLLLIVFWRGYIDLEIISAFCYAFFPHTMKYFSEEEAADL